MNGPKTVTKFQCKQHQQQVQSIKICNQLHKFKVIGVNSFVYWHLICLLLNQDEMLSGLGNSWLSIYWPVIILNVGYISYNKEIGVLFMHFCIDALT
jgi:hypothetical protein